VLLNHCIYISNFQDGVLILLCGDVELCPGPWSNNGFNIAHQNIRGLFNKKDSVADF